MYVSPVSWAIIIGYLILCCALGSYISYKNKTRSNADFYNSNRALPALAVAMVVQGTSISGVAFLGTPGNMYSYGWGQWINACTLGGNFVIITAALAVGRPIRSISEKLDSLSINGLLSTIYQDDRVLYPGSIAILIFGTLFAMVQWVSIGNLFSTLLGVSYTLAIIIGVIVVMLYTIFGGNTSNSYLSIAQMFIAMFASIYLVIVGLRVSGGLTELNNFLMQYDPDLMKLGNDGWPLMTIISYCIIYGIGSIGHPAIAQKFYGLKSKKDIPLTMFIGIIAQVVTTAMGFIGLVVLQQVEIGNLAPLAMPDNATPTFIGAFCGPFAAGLIVAACLAAIMTTGASLVMQSANTVAVDIIGGMLHRDTEGKKGVMISRISMICVFLISCVLALNPVGTIQSMGAACWVCFSTVFCGPIFLGLRWRRATKQGCLVSMWFGLILTLVLRGAIIFGGWQWPLAIDCGVVCMFATLIVFIVVSLCTPAQDKSHFMPPKRSELIKMRAAKEEAKA